ncbi:hypothetical protein DFH09DRAFT_1354679 [Mycena vulgaris]|nr:hypothetical protein DFH09DRAFT_1354679 [Mycena vulgaris]
MPTRPAPRAPRPRTAYLLMRASPTISDLRRRTTQPPQEKKPKTAKNPTQSKKTHSPSQYRQLVRRVAFGGASAAFATHGGFVQFLPSLVAAKGGGSREPEMIHPLPCPFVPLVGPQKLERQRICGILNGWELGGSVQHRRAASVR